MKKLLLVFSFLLLLLSCEKDPILRYCKKNPGDCVDVRDVKDYFYFKIGSYWVYEDEHTGLRDTVFVTETYSDPESVIFETWMHSTYDGFDYTFWTTGAGWTVENMAKKSDRSTSVNRAKTKPGEYIAKSKCFLFYPKVDLRANNDGGTYIGWENILEINNIFPKYTIFDKTFYHVVQITEEHTIVEESQPTVHYYSPKIGLIKKELIDSNQVWNLIDYHIEK